MANAEIATSVTIINSLLGFQAITLTNFTTSAESVIGAGSKVEVGSAFFNFSSNETPQASTWTAISTGNTAYITLTPSGTAGTQILTAMYSATAPVWATSKQGWYSSAASIIRHVATVFKAGTSSYARPQILDNRQLFRGETSSFATAQTRIATMSPGNWNMDNDGAFIVGLANYGLDTPCVVLAATGMVTNNAGTLARSVSDDPADGSWSYNPSNMGLTLLRVNAGTFDDAAWDSAEVQLTVWYMD